MAIITRVHNVTDRRIGWIGPWDVSSQEVVLTPDLVGRDVVYAANHGDLGVGTVTSVSDQFAFVCFTAPGSTSQAVDPRCLMRAVRSVPVEEMMGEPRH